MASFQAKTHSRVFCEHIPYEMCFAKVNIFIWNVVANLKGKVGQMVRGLKSDWYHFVSLHQIQWMGVTRVCGLPKGIDNNG